MATFISYSRTNSDFAVHLAKDLKAAGLDVWLDQLDIPTGARWDDEIEKALDNCSTFLIILSPESIQSQNVKDEMGYAIDAGKQILPVTIKNCNIPLRLRRFQYVDFSNKSYEDSLLDIKRLLNATSDPRNASKPSYGATPVEEVDTSQVTSHASSQLFGSKKLYGLSIISLLLIAIGVGSFIFIKSMSVPTSTSVPNTAVPSVTKGAPTIMTETPILPSPTALSAYFFDDGCINKNTWNLLRGDTAPDNSGCWDLGSKGIFANERAGLSFSIINPPSSRVSGLVKAVSPNTDISFDMNISELTTVSANNTNVAIGLLPSATSIPSRDGTSILFQCGIQDKPIWMMLQLPNVQQIYLPPPRILTNHVYNVKLEIRENRLITYLDNEIVDDTILSERTPFLWVGYTVAQGGKLSVTLANFSLVSR